GSLVATSPVALRMPMGAVILGSNVSVWLGPPCRNRKMTDLSVTSRFESAANSCGSDRPPRARLPILRKERRLKARSWMASTLDPLVLGGKDTSEVISQSAAFRNHLLVITEVGQGSLAGSSR